MSDRPDSAVDLDAADTNTPDPPITVCRTSPENWVFLEVGNQDGWISTDAATVPEP